MQTSKRSSAYARAGGRRNGNDAAFAAAAAEHRTSAVADLWQDVQNAPYDPTLIDRAERILDNATLSSESRTIALICLSDLHSVAGRTETALELARHALAGLNGWLAADITVLALMRVGWNLVFSGRYEEADDLLVDWRGSAPRTALHRAGTLAVIRSLLELARGQTDRARATLEEAVAELQLRDPSQALPLALELSDAIRPPGAAPAVQTETCPAAPRPRQLLARAVHSAVTGEPGDYPLIAREVLAAGRIFAPGSAGREAGQRLAELAGAMEGGRSALLARLAHLSSSNEPERAEELARDAVESGDCGIAARALARAATLWSEQGDTRRCGAALRELMGLLRTHDITPDTYTARALGMAELTSREEEIVDLARSGKTNAEIARALTVSQRTVEGHLYRVFSKLGITDRSQLHALDVISGTPGRSNCVDPLSRGVRSTRVRSLTEP